MDPLIRELLTNAGSWEQKEASAEAQLHLGLLLELHNRPEDPDVYEDYLPLPLRVAQFPHTDQAEVVRALEKLITEAPTDDARASLLSCLGMALPSMAIEPALKLLMDPPDAFAEGATQERVLFVIDHLLDFAGLPAGDPRRAPLGNVSLILERFAPEQRLQMIAADAPQLMSDRATSILRKLNRWRGGSWQEEVPSYDGGKALEELLAGVSNVDPGERRRSLTVLTQLLALEKAASDETDESIEDRYRHLSMYASAQRHVIRKLESALLGDGHAQDRIAILGALREAESGAALNLLFWILADDLAQHWSGEEMAALLTAVDEQLRDLAVVEAKADMWAIRAGAEVALPALERLTADGTPLVRQAAASVLQVLRDLQD